MNVFYRDLELQREPLCIHTTFLSAVKDLFVLKAPYKTWSTVRKSQTQFIWEMKRVTEQHWLHPLRIS